MASKKDQKPSNSDLISALKHPLRIRILQRLADGSMGSPNQLSQEFGEPLGNLSYHVKTLLEYNCVRLVKTEPRRGAVEHFYRSKVKQDWALEVLGLKPEPEEESEGAAPAAEAA